MDNQLTIGSGQSVRQAVEAIKSAIVQSQSRAARLVVGEQLSLYFGVGLYVSEQSKHYAWGTGALRQISDQLYREMPGLRGFSEQSIRNMRQFADFWQPFIIGQSSSTAICSPTASKLPIPDMRKLVVCDYFDLANWSPAASEINREEFLGISFSHHMEILHKVKDLRDVIHCMHLTYTHRWDKYKLRAVLKEGVPQHEDVASNNFVQTISPTSQAMKAIRMFKDEYLLDFINVEDITAHEEDVDERVIEQRIVENIKTFIMTLGKDFAFVGNQYHLEVYGEESFPDLLFFNRELNCLVVVELKYGKFKTAYLGQLFGYLQILDDYVRKPHENPSIGIILCKSANQAHAEYAVRDYSKPMGVATYRTADEMPDSMRKVLLPTDEIIKLMDVGEQ